MPPTYPLLMLALRVGRLVEDLVALETLLYVCNEPGNGKFVRHPLQYQSVSTGRKNETGIGRPYEDHCRIGRYGRNSHIIGNVANRP